MGKREIDRCGAHLAGLRAIFAAWWASLSAVTKFSELAAASDVADMVRTVHPLVQPDSMTLQAMQISIVSLVVAVFAALTGAGALVWQITTRRRGSHHVKVTVGPSRSDLSADGDMVHLATAANIGASDVELRGWGLMQPGGRYFVAPRALERSTTLPHVLKAGTSARYMFSSRELRSILAQGSSIEPADLRVFVALGTGAKVYSKTKGVGSVLGQKR